MVFSNVRPCVHIGQLLSLIQICLNCPIDFKLPFYGCCLSCFWLTLLYPQEVEKYLSLFLVCSCHCFNYVQNHSLMKLFIVHIQNDVILAYHWSIEMYTGLLLGIQSVHWPIILHLYCMTSFFISTIKSFLSYSPYYFNLVLWSVMMLLPLIILGNIKICICMTTPK